ncbi:MAG: hypothetical protein H0W96_13245 [Solirubrobacterales bacterium]|jgi:hypothetical protein|nr:hypothetical protein [Solirubrobacterales bacterium]
MIRSNFTQIRMSDDGATLHVNGITDAVGEILELRVTVAAPKPADPLLVGADLAPLAEQVEHAIAAPVTEPWTVDVPIEPGMFKRGDTVLLAGGTVRWTPARTQGVADGGRLTLETWIGCTTVMSDSDVKP